MKSIQKFLLFLLFVTSGSSLFSVIVYYCHVKVGGKDVYLLGDAHVYCAPGQDEAKKLLYYLFSKKERPDKTAFIIECNEKDIKDVYEKEEQKEDFNKKDCALKVVDVRASNVMMNILRHVCYLYSSNLNKQISFIFGDARGSELMKDELRDASRLDQEFVDVINNSLCMLLNPCFSREFVEKNLGKIRNIIKKINAHDVCRKKILELTDVYFYIQTQFYLLTHDKVILYAGAEHTKVVANMLLENKTAKYIYQCSNDPFFNLFKWCRKTGESIHDKVKGFQGLSLVFPFLPIIFGIKIPIDRGQHFSRREFELFLKNVAIGEAVAAETGTTAGAEVASEAGVAAGEGFAAGRA